MKYLKTYESLYSEEDIRIKDYLGDNFIEFKWREHPITRKDGDNLYIYTNLTERTNIDRAIWAVAIEYDISERIQESKDEVTEVLKDIFLEVSDIDNEIKMSVLRPITYNDFNITNRCKKEDDIDIMIDKISGESVHSFLIDNIEEIIHRMINYMSSLGYESYIFCREFPAPFTLELVMSEGDYTRCKVGSAEYRYYKPISRLQIKFRKE